jgi:hypothetical protein
MKTDTPPRRPPHAAATLVATALHATTAAVSVAAVFDNGGMETWHHYTPPPSLRAPALPGQETPAGIRPHTEVIPAHGDATDPVESTLARDAAIKHSGEYSLRLDNKRDTDIVAAVVSPFPVKANTRYRIKLWLRGADITANKNWSDGGIFVWTHFGPTEGFMTAENKRVAHLLPVALRRGTFDWTQVEFPLVTAANTERLRITLQLRLAKGSAWFDDLDIEEVGPATPGRAC